MANTATSRRKTAKKVQLTLGKRIQKIRLARRMTQEDLAAKCNVSRGAVAQWENDKNNPDVEHLTDVARHLEVAQDWLTTGEGPLPDCLMDEQGQPAPARRNVRRLRYAGVDAPDDPGVLLEVVSSIGVGTQPGKDFYDWWRLPHGLLKETLRSNAADVLIFRIGADGMEVDVNKGDRVGIDTSKKIPRDGLFAIDNGIGYLLKRLAITPDGIKAGDAIIQPEHIVGECVFIVRLLLS